MATAKRKVVTKDDLRKLMKEKQSLTKDSSKKITHPLAKYNSLNQLVCMLCNNVIKNDLLWNSHIQSKQHKEKAIAVKTQGPAKPEYLSNTNLKRTSEDTPVFDGKRQKTGVSSDSQRLPNSSYDDSKTSKNDIRERAKAAFLAGYSSSSSSDSDDDDDDEEEDGNETAKQKIESTSLTLSSKNGLPEDFFDSKDVASSDEIKPESSHSKKMAEKLPEGFFDDPKMDAKVREVVYKDKEEEEWELFQKAIKEEAHVSEVIMAEEDEQVNIDRNIDEIDDQIHRWQEVENLHVKKETVLKNSKADGQKKDDSGDDVDDEELDEFLDWRAKKSLK